MKLPFKHMTGIGRTIEEAEIYRESRDLLKSLAKYLPTTTKLSQWIEIDKEMDGVDIEELPAIFQRVTRSEFPWQLGLCPRPIVKPWQLISDDKLRTLEIWQAFGKLLTTLENTEHKGVLLFRLNRLGVWVMHNLDAPKSGVFICLPAQQAANNNIIFEPLNSWAERNYK